MILSIISNTFVILYKYQSTNNYAHIFFYYFQFEGYTIAKPVQGSYFTGVSKRYACNFSVKNNFYMLYMYTNILLVLNLILISGMPRYEGNSYYVCN